MLRDSYITALERISQQVGAPKPAPVKRKNSKDICGAYVAVQQGFLGLRTDYPLLKIRKIDLSEFAVQQQPFTAEPMVYEHEVKPRPGPADISGSSRDTIKQPVRKEYLSEQQSDSGITLRKGNHPPPLILAEKIENCEDYLSSQKLGRVENARQLRFQSQMLGRGVYTGASTRPGAGLGLYAGMNFDAHALITECVGKMENIPSGDKDRKQVWGVISDHYESWSHLVEISEHQILQCIRKPEFNLGGGSFANDSRPDQPNARFVRIWDKVKGEHRAFIKSLQPIKTGREITVDYGDGFWRSFKEAFPKQYEDIFGEAFFNIKDRDQDFQKIIQKIIQKSIRKTIRKDSEQALADLLNRTGPVPPEWDELKINHHQWSANLCIYALYKYRKIEPGMLTPEVLGLLKKDSAHYFTALAKYVVSQKITANLIVSRWRNNQIRLEIPCNDVFQEGNKAWTAGHLHVFYRLFDQDSYFTQVSGKEKTIALMYVLKVLNPKCSLYEQLITEYIFKHLATGFDQVINFYSMNTKVKMNNLLASLYHSLPPVPLTVCGEPLGDTWNTECVKELLQRKGVHVVETNGWKYMSPYQQMGMLYEDDKDNYIKGFLAFCRDKDYKFASIARGSNRSKSDYGIQLPPIPGVKYIEEKVNKNTVFFQYIHYAGIDRKQVYEQATNTTLHRCINMIGPKYKGSVSQFDLLAIALSRCSVSHNKRIRDGIRKVRNSTSLPENLRALPNSKLYSVLQTHGRKLQQEYEELKN